MCMDVDRIVATPEGPDAVAQMQEQILAAVGELMQWVIGDAGSLSLLDFERGLWPRFSLLYRLLVALFLTVRQQQFDIEAQRPPGWRIKIPFALRKIKTRLGEVIYGRAYLTRRNGGGWHPLDAALGVTRDGFSMQVIDLITRLATRMSYQASRSVATAILGWSPSVEAIETLAVGMGGRAQPFMETRGAFDDDGEVLVIELDGKAIPTATQEELEKRRGKRPKKTGGKCKCQRHRGRRKRRGKKKKRKSPGHNGKNGRSFTLVAMYTLRRGDDGKLHGPLNKKIWGQLGKRHDMMKWVRRQATRRGFDPESDRQVQIIVDGEPCLRKRMRELFPKATFCLDIRHPQERLWKLGRHFHPRGSEPLEAWVAPLNELLLAGKVDQLLEELRSIEASISRRGPGTKTKRCQIAQEIKYIEKRKEMMRYAEFRKKDLVMATGVIEGACRYVIGERLDCSGMRWIPEGGEPLLQLRCIELNGDWDAFIDWSAGEIDKELSQGVKVQIRTEPAKPPPDSILETAS